jgi:hypothetical protein
MILSAPRTCHICYEEFNPPVAATYRPVGGYDFINSSLDVVEIRLVPGLLVQQPQTPLQSIHEQSERNLNKIVPETRHAHTNSLVHRWNPARFPAHARWRSPLPRLRTTGVVLRRREKLRDSAVAQWPPLGETWLRGDTLVRTVEPRRSFI